MERSHRRLERAQAALEQRTTLTPDETKAILKARAKALAREQEPDQCEQDRLEVIEFVLADEKYAVESSFVREVYPFREFTPIPGAPPFVLGIINVRGHIVSVVDLKKFFGLPEKGLTDLSKPFSSAMAKWSSASWPILLWVCGIFCSGICRQRCQP